MTLEDFIWCVCVLVMLVFGRPIMGNGRSVRRGPPPKNQVRPPAYLAPPPPPVRGCYCPCCEGRCKCK